MDLDTVWNSEAWCDVHFFKIKLIYFNGYLWLHSTQWDFCILVLSHPVSDGSSAIKAAYLHCWACFEVYMQPTLISTPFWNINTGLLPFLWRQGGIVQRAHSRKTMSRQLKTVTVTQAGDSREVSSVSSTYLGLLRNLTRHKHPCAQIPIYCAISGSQQNTEHHSVATAH